MAKSGGTARGKPIAGLGLVTAILAASLSPAVAEPPKSGPVAPDRFERWRAAKKGTLQLPLAGTPDTETPLARLASAGVSLGVPIMIRIFKAESELEVWVKKGSTYTRFATYPICYWSGTLGPKLREGDRQTPEGFYSLTERELHHGGRWRRSLNIGYPNVFDRANGRSGSLILVHGGCDSIGCFAMTDAVNAELYEFVSAALRSSTDNVPLHVFPFRMTDANLATYPPGTWKDFWSDLKQGYDSFERTHLPPHITVCSKRYHIRDASMFERETEGIALCPQDRNTVPEPQDQQQQASSRPPSRARMAKRAEKPAPPCNMALASCRKWVALRDRRSASRTIAIQSSSKRSAVR